MWTYLIMLSLRGLKICSREHWMIVFCMHDVYYTQFKGDGWWANIYVNSHFMEYICVCTVWKVRVKNMLLDYQIIFIIKKKKKCFFKNISLIIIVTEEILIFGNFFKFDSLIRWLFKLPYVHTSHHRKMKNQTSLEVC